MILIQRFSVNLKINLFKKPLRFVKFHHKYIFPMNKAYLKCTEGAEEYQINFHYRNSELNVDRTFNFCRRVTETVETFLARVSTNVEKIVAKKNKKKKDKSEKSDVTVLVDLIGVNGAIDKSITCQEVFKQTDLTLTVLENNYKIVKNCPWINCIILPCTMLANYPVYPAKFEVSFAKKELSDFIWYKSKDKKTWIHVGNSFIFKPTNDEINHYLKLCCQPKNDTSEGPCVEIVSNVVVEASPGQCPFEIRHQLTNNKKTGQEFRVVSYNILADLYCDSDFSRSCLYPYCPPYALHIDYRKLLFMKELMGYNPDIICLQEVDRKIYINDLEPVFSSLGYSSHFCLKGGQVAEGLACFFDENRFRILEKDGIVFSECLESNKVFKDIWEAISKNEKLKERILARTTTIEIVALEAVESKKVLLVANTHLYFHPDADHIRLLQGALAIKYIQFKKEKLEKDLNSKVSVIFCGDFNSVPECGIYQLYTTGCVPTTCADWKSNKEEAIEGLNVSQPLKLASACGTPEYTNYTSGFKGCLDYIYYDTESLDVTEVIPLPSNSDLSEHTALPSVLFPSDHISLVANLKWK